MTARSIADGLNAPFAGELAIRIAKERGLEVVLVADDEIEDAMRFLYERAKLASEPAGAAAVAALRARKVPLQEGRTVVAVVTWRQRFGRNGCRYPGPTVKPDIHPEYVTATVQAAPVAMSSRRSTKPELHVEICLNCHPFHTGKQKLLDTGGRVERFNAGSARAALVAAATPKLRA